MNNRLIKMAGAVFFGILLVSLLLAGCGGEEEINITAEQLDQILAETADANSSITTCQYDIDISEAVKVTGGTDPGTMTIEISGDAEIDIVNKAMRMLMTMSIAIPGRDEEDMEIDTYMVGEWIYIKENKSIIGNEWKKMEWTEKVWDAQNQIAGQMKMLNSGEIECNRSETIDGVDCYVFEIVPDEETLVEYMVDLGLPGMGEIQNLEEVLSSSSIDITQWVAKDSFLFLKGENHLKMELSHNDVVGATEEDFEKMTLDVVAKIKTYDFNQPVTIELPAEALGAQEISQ